MEGAARRWTLLGLVWLLLSISAEAQSPDSLLTVTGIELKGNKITRDNIILRELEFYKGQTYAAGRLDTLIIRSRQNLLNRSLFNFVTISEDTRDDSTLITVEVVERWYIWPIPIFSFADRNFNAWLEKRDLGRLNYGIDFRVENFRGRMEQLNLIVQAGYDQQFRVLWKVPYLDKREIVGFHLEASVQMNHETAIRTIDNKPEYVMTVSQYARTIHAAGAGISVRPGFNYLHELGIIFSQTHYLDSLLMLNPELAPQTTTRFLQLSYTFKLDFRDYKPYPLNGYYFDVRVQKQGLGVFQDGVDVLWVGTTFDQYIPLHKRWYLAYNFSTRISGDRPRPWFLHRGLGYDDLNVRGYELYVVEGQNYGVIKTNLKMTIIPQTNYVIKWIRSPRFNKIFYALYANLFFDMGYVSDRFDSRLNPLSNQLLWGTGVGLDVVSYYDSVIRFEFAVNKQRQTGFFIDFVAPI